MDLTKHSADQSETGRPSAPEPEHRLTSDDARNEILFRLVAPNARHVGLIGDFTGWAGQPIALRHDETGAWWTKVLLARGRYAYRYVVDGQAQVDPDNRDEVSSPDGNQSSVLQVL